MVISKRLEQFDKVNGYVHDSYNFTKGRLKVIPNCVGALTDSILYVCCTQGMMYRWAIAHLLNQ